MPRSNLKEQGNRLFRQGKPRPNGRSFLNVHRSALRPMGPAHKRDPRDAWRRSRCASLATLPRVAFRPPPLTPAPPAERLRSMASRSRHRSAVVAERGLSRRVTERHRATLPMGRVSSASAQPALTCPGSRCFGNWLAPCRQDMDSVARNHLAACGGGRTAPKSLPPIISWDACCVPAQALSHLARSGSPTTCAQVPRTPSSPSLSRAA